MTNANGVSLDAFNPDHMLGDVAQQAFDAIADEGETWAGLPDDERGGVLALVEATIHAFTASLKEHGVKLLPPGVVATPKTEDEAAAMAVAIRQFKAAQKRRGGLITSSAGLVVPTHVKLKGRPH